MSGTGVKAQRVHSSIAKDKLIPKQLAQGALTGMWRTKGAPISMMHWHKEQGRRISGMIWTTAF